MRTKRKATPFGSSCFPSILLICSLDIWTFTLFVNSKLCNSFTNTWNPELPHHDHLRSESSGVPKQNGGVQNVATHPLQCKESMIALALVQLSCKSVACSFLESITFLICGNLYKAYRPGHSLLSTFSQRGWIHLPASWALSSVENSHCSPFSFLFVWCRQSAVVLEHPFCSISCVYRALAMNLVDNRQQRRSNSDVEKQPV